MRRPREALANVDSLQRLQEVRSVETEDWMNQQWAPFPLDLWRGRAYLLLGDTARARAAFARHIPRLEELRDEMPGLSLRSRFLALAYAGAGRREEAIREAELAGRLALETGDLWAEIPNSDENLLEVFVLAGDLDRAFDVLSRIQAANPQGLLVRLRTDPSLDPLRGDPRFDEVVRAASVPIPGAR
jgi:tetratricopeptide (TPR) repeat protein